MRNLLTAGAIALVSTVSAQSIKFGVTAGANVDFASLKDKAENTKTTYKSEVGGFAGLFLEYRENKYFRVQAGANYMFDKSVTKKESSGAIQLPIALKFYVLADKLNIQVGPRLTYSLDKYADLYNPINFSGAIGVGYEFNKCFFVDANYIHQLNDGINKDYNDNLSEKTNYAQIGLGYRF